jgi:hypothetical protein
MHVRPLCLAGHPRPCSHLSFSIAITGALIAGTYALAKRRGRVVASIYAASAALNCGIASATFFSTLTVYFSSVPASLLVGCRGYVIVPLLDQTLPSRLHERESARRVPASPEAPTGGATTWGAMRSHRVLDSALSGGITGSVLNTWRRSSLRVPFYFMSD